MLSFTRQDKKTIAAVVGKNQAVQTKWNTPYSRVRFTTTLASNVFTIAKGTVVRAFSYGTGGDMASAGQSSNPATDADTSLQQGQYPNSGENYLIKGIGLIPLAGSDAHLLKQADGQISVQLILNGSNIYKLGIPSMLPGPGGLYGQAEAASILPSPFEVVNGNIGAMSNGVPSASNFFAFPESLIWRSAGNADSSLNVVLKSEYAISTNTNYAGASRTAEAQSSSFSGTNAYTQPAASGVYLDFMVVLLALTFTPQSQN